MNNQSISKVFFLGMDGIDPNILENLMDSGRAPAFAKLREQGTYRRLSTINPSQSPVIWSTIATGSNPAYHAIYDYIARKPENYLPIHSTVRLNPMNILSRRDSTFLQVRKGRAFWSFTSEAKIPTRVLRYPVSFPPEPVNGCMLSGLGVLDLYGNIGRYTFYAEGPVTGDIDKKGNIIRVSAKNNFIKTYVPGPNRVQTTLEINLDRQNEKITCIVDNQKFTLKPGDWSDWVSFKFNLPFRQIMGIGQFCLQSVNPHLRLYLTSVQVDPRKTAFPITYPDSYASELAEKIGTYSTLGLAEDTNALIDDCIDDEAFLHLCDGIMKEREKMLWYELERFKDGLLAYVFDTTDRIQHIYWATIDKEHPIYNAEYATKYQNVIKDYYIRQDRILQRVLKAIDDKTVLIIASDHGFGSFRRAVNINTWLVHNGLMTLKKPSQDEQGDPLFKNVVWEKTKAYAVGFNSIYLNLKGREGKGFISPGEEAEQLKRKIAEVLLSLRDPGTGKGVIHGVYTDKELFHGPYADEAPDLIIGFNANYRSSWQTAIGGVPPKILEDNTKKWSGEHISDAEFVPGIFFINRKITRNSPNVMHIAPTILGCFGIPKPESMEQKSLLD